MVVTSSHELNKWLSFCCCCYSLTFLSDHELQLGHPALQVEQVLVQVGLLGLQSGDGGLGLLVLWLLGGVALTHVFFGPVTQIMNENVREVKKQIWKTSSEGMTDRHSSYQLRQKQELVVSSNVSSAYVMTSLARVWRMSAVLRAKFCSSSCFSPRRVWISSW